jgi:hypothetical protein
MSIENRGPQETLGLIQNSPNSKQRFRRLKTLFPNRMLHKWMSEIRQAIWVVEIALLNQRILVINDCDMI